MTLGSCLALATILIASVARADECDRMAAATANEHTFPLEMTLTISGHYKLEGKLVDAGQSTHVVFVDGLRYLQAGDGHWTVGPWKPGEDDAFDKNLAAQFIRHHCVLKGSDMIDGETVDIVEDIEDNENGRLAERQWISRASGLLLREEFDIAAKDANLRMVITARYRDVQAPAGVH